MTNIAMENPWIMENPGLLIWLFHGQRWLKMVKDG